MDEIFRVGSFRSRCKMELEIWG